MLAFFFAETAAGRTAAVGYGFALLFVWFDPPTMVEQEPKKKKKKKKRRRQHSFTSIDAEDVHKLLNDVV